MSGGLRKDGVDRFALVPRPAVRADTMSYRALGLLTYLLDAPTGWDVRSEQLSRGEGREGREAVRTALRELAAHGYYRLERRRLRDGTCAMGTAISPTPREDWIAESTRHGHRAVDVIEQADGTYRTAGDEGEPETTGDGFPGAGLPDAGGPGAGFLGASRETVKGDSQGTTAPPADAAGGEAQPEPDTLIPEPTPIDRKGVSAPNGKRKGGSAPKGDRAETLSEAQDLQRRFHCWWTKERAPIPNSGKAALAVRGMIADALTAGYTLDECRVALNKAACPWPTRPVWSRCLTEARTGRAEGRGATQNAHRSTLTEAEREQQRAAFG